MKAIEQNILLFLAMPSCSSAFATVMQPQLVVGAARYLPQTKSRFPARAHRKSLLAVDGDTRLGDERGEAKRAWPRRIWSRITRKGLPRNRESTAAPLNMMAIDEETEALLLDSITSYYNSEDFILKNFEEVTPDMILPDTTSPGLDSEFFDVAITNDSPPVITKHQRHALRYLSISNWTGRLCESTLRSLIERLALEQPENLSVQAFPRGRPVPRLLRGKLSIDARVDVGRLVFSPIRMSSGTLGIKRLTLNILSFLPSQRQTSSRFPKQFDLHADDWTFSRHDLLFSPCIRNGLQRLLVRILRDRGVQSSSIKVTSLDILPSGKVSCKGEAKTLFGSPLSFEVRSGISFTCRGHVLTFPGLEVSLSRDLGLFVPVVPTIDLDVGHNASFRKIEIDGKQKLLRLSASVTITPESTIRLNDYVQSSEAFSAKFSIDVGRWLTQIGNFTR